MSTLRSIELFLRRTGMAATRFGREAVRDPRLVHDLRNGRELTERMRRRLEHFMNIHEREPAE
jgi:2,4-dienoyl-CoA reductase-like NADH-dependent reductase (Old Yellow Enzyme family)